MHKGHGCPFLLPMPNETKHTSGDWRYSGEYSEITTSRVGVLEGSKSIAQLSAWGKSEEEVLANGVLIAAAPELLEALNGIVEQFEKSRAMVPADLADEIRLFGKQAIAKAIGKR